MKIEDLKKVMLEKTTQIFVQTLKNLDQKDQQALTSLNSYFYWIDFLNKAFPANKEVMILLNEATFDLVSSLFNSFSGFYRCIIPPTTNTKSQELRTASPETSNT